MARAATRDLAELAESAIELAVFADDDPSRIRATIGDRTQVDAQYYVDTASVGWAYHTSAL